MADTPVISPDVAGQLANSSFIKDESNRNSLTQLSTPEQEAAAQLMEVARPVVQEAALQSIAEEKQDETELVQLPSIELEPELPQIGFDTKTEEDVLRQRLLDPMIDTKTKLEALEELKKRKSTSEDPILSAEMKARSIQTAAQEYENELAAVNSYNADIKKLGLGDEYLKPVPQPIEFGSAEDLDFVLKSGMDVSPALAQNMAANLDEVADAKDLELKKKQERDAINTQKAQAQVSVEETKKTQDKSEKATEENDEKVKSVDKQYTSLSEMFNDASTGRRVGAAIAIMVGGLAQGFSGGSVNPVLAMFDKEFKTNLEKQVAANKLQAELQKAAAQANDPMLKMKMAKMGEEIIKYGRENRQAAIEERVMAQGGSTPLSPQEIATIPAESKVRDLFVTIPDTGETYRGNNKKNAEDANTALKSITPGLKSIDILLEAFDDPNFNRADLLDPKRGALNTELQAVVGALRIPILGPGVMTDQERNFVINLLGSPTKLASIGAIEKAKLKAAKASLKRNIDIQLKTANVNLPKDPAIALNNANVEKFIKERPKATKYEAIMALQKTNQWHPEK